MAAWKLAPALAAGNCVVLKPAETTPISLLILVDLISHLLPPGVLNIVNGYGHEVGSYLANSKRIAKLAFTGSTAVGRKCAAAAAANLIPCTLELGGKSPNVFFADIMSADDDLFDKALEGFVMFAFNSGEVCTCPSRALIEESIYDAFMARALVRVKAIKKGNPLDGSVALGAQNSALQLERIMGHVAAAHKEGAECLVGGVQATLPGAEGGGFYVEPTIFMSKDHKLRIFQDEVFGPVLAVTTFKTEAEAIAIANDTSYGLGAGVWTRDVNVMHRMARGIKAGRIWVRSPLAAPRRPACRRSRGSPMRLATRRRRLCPLPELPKPPRNSQNHRRQANCYHAYPAGATFGGYKESGLGRETHKCALGAYQQVKCILQSYSPAPLGFF